jgi:hypothetical protein
MTFNLYDKTKGIIKKKMQIFITRIVWLILPVFGRALTNHLVRNNVNLIAVFLANASLSSLAWLLVTATQGNSLRSTLLGRNFMSFLGTLGINGPGAAAIGYWMVLAAVVAKIFWIAFWLLLSPLLGATLYWAVKSMGWSVYYLQAAYDQLPDAVKDYFIYINREIMLQLQIWLAPVVDTGKEYGKIILYIKAFINIGSVMLDSVWFNHLFDTYIDPAIWRILTLPYVGAVLASGIDFSSVVYFKIIALGQFFLPTFMSEFIGWVFSKNLGIKFVYEWIISWFV